MRNFDNDVPPFTRAMQAQYVRFARRTYGLLTIALRHPSLFAKLHKATA